MQRNHAEKPFLPVNQTTLHLLIMHGSTSDAGIRPFKQEKARLTSLPQDHVGKCRLSP